MTESRIARGLMMLGAGVGVASVTVWALELQMNLPDWIVRVAMFKLAFIAAGGSLAAGAVVGRHANMRQLPSGDVERLPAERAEPLMQKPAYKLPNARAGASHREDR